MKWRPGRPDRRDGRSSAPSLPVVTVTSPPQFYRPSPPRSSSFLSLLPFAASLIFFFLICLHHSIPLLTQKVNLSETGIFSHAAPTPRRSLSLPPPLLFFFFPILFSLFFFLPLSLPSTDSTAPVWRVEGRNGLKTFGASFWFHRATCFIQKTRLPVTTHLSIVNAAQPGQLAASRSSFFHHSHCFVLSQMF